MPGSVSHARKHGLDATRDHKPISGSEDQLVSLNNNLLPKSSGRTPGAIGGVATLDSGGKVPLSQIPDSLIGGMVFKGLWDASTGNYPADPEVGWFWKINVAGTLGGVFFEIGDLLVCEAKPPLSPIQWGKIETDQGDLPIKGYAFNKGNNPPPSPADGEIWLILGAPTGIWVSQEWKTAQWYQAGLTWVIGPVQQGDIWYVISEHKLYIHNTSGEWADISTIIDHSLITGITANQHHNQSHDIVGTDHSGIFRQVDYFWISDVYGNDTTGDGSILKPYKTIQKAIDMITSVGFILYDETWIAVPPTFTVPTGKSISIMDLTGVRHGGGYGLYAVVESGASLKFNNVEISSLTGPLSGYATVIFEDSFLVNITNPSHINVEFYGTRISTPVFGVIGSFNSITGYYLYSTGINPLRMYIVGGLDAGTRTITQVGNPVNNTDADNLQSRNSAISTHAGLPEAHHKAFQVVNISGTPQSNRKFLPHSADYVAGGITVDYTAVGFSAEPTVSVSIKLKNLADSVYPLSAKITAKSMTSLTVKVYKMVVSGIFVVAEECATNDVVVELHIVGV